MLNQKIFYLFFFPLIFFSMDAGAQQKGELEDPMVPQPVDEVIHGFYTSARFGLQAFIVGAVAEDTKNIRGTGLSTGLGLGYDVTDWFSPEILVGIGANSRDNSDPNKEYQILGSSIPTYTFQLRLDFAYNLSKRFRIGGNVGGGVLTTLDNKNVFGATNRAGKIKKEISAAVLPMFAVAASIEYYTNLRHFSTGLMLEYMHVLGDVNSGALALLPMVKYTF
ncbi:MAG: adventurous gliding motility protein CglE [Deltaproteobacteria bacterium]|nr:adventurous gliding motility protein CglE [Deltaproteobacteria bacterium]